MNILTTQRQTLDTLWQQGLQGRALLRAYTDTIDAHLFASFTQNPDATRGMALLALGGYGRRELFPFSDIDLLLLYDDGTADRIDAAAQALFYPLWDAGLEVGHSVRTVEGCLEDGAEDFFFQVALLDARLLAGDDGLFARLQQGYRKRFIDDRPDGGSVAGAREGAGATDRPDGGSAAGAREGAGATDRPDGGSAVGAREGAGATGRVRFLENMEGHRQKRRERYGAHGFILEPHVKESRGGLRDIQAILWTAQVFFGIKTIDALITAGIITAREQARLEEAWDHLIHIRNRLHYLCGRKNDQLFFEQQEELASIFGFTGREGMLPVECFMQRVHESMQHISIAADLFFDHVREVAAGASGAMDREEKVLEANIVLAHGAIRVMNPAGLDDQPQQLMRVFLHSARLVKPIHHRTWQHIHDRLALMTDRLRHSRRLARAFLEIIMAGGDGGPLAMDAMLESGLLGAYLPEFQGIAALAQHDVYHIFTVDRHLLQTVTELARLEKTEPAITGRLENLRVLYLAGLLHDIGKGKGQDHAVLGAKRVTVIASRLALSDTESDDLAFLVRNHLYLAHTALRRDLDDDKLLFACSQHIGTLARLDMLYLLTIADARATGPAAWSDWKAALLAEFHLRLTHAIAHGDLRGSEFDQSRAVSWMRDQVAAVTGSVAAGGLEFMSADYLLYFSASEIAEHLALRQRLDDEDLILLPAERAGRSCAIPGTCDTSSIRSVESWSLLIVTRDRPGLLGKICGVLAMHHLQVLQAQIFTWDDATVVDSIHVASTLGLDFAEKDWDELRCDLLRAFHNRLGLDYRVSRASHHRGRRPRHPRNHLQTEVRIDNSISDTYTVIEIFAADRSGLLYDITRTLSELGMNIFRARIGTQADRAVDVFYVLAEDGKKLEDREYMEEVRLSLVHTAGPVAG